ncbi:hypothetical protein ABIA33_005585 [Streptacidiphilus sp. MAP12-16]
MTRNLEERMPGVLERLREDPFDELSRWDDIKVIRVSADETRRSVDTGNGCSVLGQYNGEDTPPSITVVGSTGPGRPWFTVLHELGHHEQRGDLEWFDSALSRQADDGWELEEQVCEAFAADILLGDDVATAVLNGKAVDASAVPLLHKATGASRMACCVRVSQLFGGECLVLITDLTGRVYFSASAGDIPRPKIGTPQASNSLPVRAASAGSIISSDAVLTYATGRVRSGFRAHSVRDGKYVYSIFATGFAPWSKLDISRPVEWSELDWFCESCQEHSDGYELKRCPTCQQGKCPSCNACPCGAASERICLSCHLTWSIARFAKGSDVCRDCD